MISANEREGWNWTMCIGGGNVYSVLFCHWVGYPLCFGFAWPGVLDEKIPDALGCPSGFEGRQTYTHLV